MAKTIWLSNDGGHKDYNKAKEVVPGADIKPLTIGSVNIFRTDRLLQELTRGIANYASSEDYLLPSGSSMVTALAIQVWLSAHGECRLLLWHAVKRCYIETIVDLEHISDLVEREMMRGAA